MLSNGAPQTEIVLLEIADISKNLSSLAILKSESVFGIILRQSKSLFVSMFHNLIFSFEAANKYSAFLSSSNVRFVIGELSIGVTLILENCSKSQYFTVLSVDPLAKAKFWGLYYMQVIDYPGIVKCDSVLPDAMSQILKLPSSPPEATHLESGDNCTLFNTPVCSLYV